MPLESTSTRPTPFTFWMPTVSDFAAAGVPVLELLLPQAAMGAGNVGVVKRPDGTRQVTLDGMPLYTFVQDSPGQITGDGFQDKFGGMSFTWHVVLAGGSKGTGTTAAGSSGSYGY